MLELLTVHEFGLMKIKLEEMCITVNGLIQKRQLLKNPQKLLNHFYFGASAAAGVARN